jgi:hypothetical protein
MADFNLSDNLDFASGSNDDLIESFFAGDTPEQSKEKVEDVPTEDQDKAENKDKDKVPVEAEGKTELTEEALEYFLGGETPEEIDDKAEKTEDEDDAPESAETETDDAEESEYGILSKGLVKLGIFAEDEQQPLPTTGDELAERFQKETDRMVAEKLDAILTQKGSDRVKLFQDLIVNGVDPREYLETMSEILNLKDLDIKDEETQEQVIRESLKREGIKTDKIELRLKRLKELGPDVVADEAENRYNHLLQSDESELERLAQEKAQQETLLKQARAQYVESVSKIVNDKAKEKLFDGIPVTEKTKNEALDYLTSYRFKLSDGELITPLDKLLRFDLKRPENYELLAKVALLAVNNFDLSKVKITAVSTETNKVFGDLAKKKTKQKINTKPQIQWFK